MNRKGGFQRFFAFALTLILVLAFPAVAFATDISVTADSTSVNVGDTVTLTVIVSAEHIAVANGVFTYDPALLSYVSSDGGASDGYINIVSAQSGGSASLTAVIKFVALGAGDAVINVSMDSVLSYDGQPLEAAAAGVSITVASSGTSTGEPGVDTSGPPVDLTQTGVAAQNVMGTAAQMYIWRSLGSLTLPAGFADRQVTYAGEFVGGAAVPDSEDIVLLYLSEAAGENAGYYIYKEDKNILFPYITMLSVAANYTIIWPDENVIVPEGYVEAALTWKEKDVPAWTAQGADAVVYLVYARNAAGETGFYLFNIEDESMQRFAALPEYEPATTAAAAETPSAKPVAEPSDDGLTDAGMKIDPVLFIVLIVVCGILAATVAVFIILYLTRNSRNRRYTFRRRERKSAASKDKNTGA